MKSLKFGLIGGLIASSMLIGMTVICYQSGKFEGNMLLGYAFMLAAFSMVFIGVKNYRDKIGDGTITFAKAFKVGISIVFVASTVYVLVWLICYYVFIPDFMEKYVNFYIEDLKSKGVTATQLKSEMDGMAFYKQMYSNPFGVILLTYLEIFPVGLIVCLITAAILRRFSTGFNEQK